MRHCDYFLKVKQTFECMTVSDLRGCALLCFWTKLLLFIGFVSPVKMVQLGGLDLSLMDMNIK